MADAFDPYHKWLGIAPDERPVDHYRLLGLARFEPDQQVITTAADQRMAQIRRYQTGPRAAETQRILNELSAAKLCLLNPASRSAYDDMLRGMEAATAAERAEVPPTPPGPTIDVSGGGRSTTRRPNTARSSTARSSRGHSSTGHPTRPRPYYLKPWFPLLAVTLSVAIAFLVWSVGSALRPSTVQSSTTATTSPPPPVTTPPVEATRPAVTIQQEASGDFHLTPSMAQMAGANLQLEAAGLDEIVTGFRGLADTASWHLRLQKLPPHGAFRLRVTYQTTDSAELLIGVNNKEERHAPRTSSDFVTDEYIVVIPTKGTHHLTLRSAGSTSLRVRSLQLSFAAGRN